MTRQDIEKAETDILKVKLHEFIDDLEPSDVYTLHRMVSNFKHIASLMEFISKIGGRWSH